MIKCPILKCSKEFYTKSSLVNHLRKIKDTEHNSYYDNNIKKKKCNKCGKVIDNRSKHKDVCWTCLNYCKSNKKEITKEWLHRLCFKCKQPVYKLLSKMNSRVLCDNCIENKIKIKKEYNKRFDANRYANLKVERKIVRDNKNSEIVSKLIINLKKDILDFNFPLYKICDKYSISLQYIKKVTKNILTEEDYNKRVLNSRRRAFILSIGNRKKPNNLELSFGKQIAYKIPFSGISYNVWKTVKDASKNVWDKNAYRHLEIDLILKLQGVQIYLLCDGVMFHGVNSKFCGDTVAIDEYKGRLLNTDSPYVIRYSEIEIKKGWAVDHLKDVVKQIQRGIICTYYRNWMTHEEIIKY